MANELRMAGRQMLRASLVPRAPLIIPRPAFRALSTTAPRPSPRDLKSKAAFPPRPTPAGRPNAPKDAATPGETPGSRFSPSTLASARSAATDHVYDATSADTFDLSAIIAKESEEFMSRHYKTVTPQLRMKPVLGRFFPVTGNVDLAAALGKLNRLTKSTKIRTYYHSQRQYERPGLRRKRLKSERWRKNFRTGFLHTVERVRELAKQGW